MNVLPRFSVKYLSNNSHMKLVDEINFQFKLETAENYERFSEMARLCFGTHVFDASYFKWKYLDNPAGPAMAFAAVHEDEPAATFCIIPELYLINGQPVKIYQGMDVMTHPKYRRRGLSIKLADMGCNHIVEMTGGINIFGLPSPAVTHGLVSKLGWKTIHDFSYYFAHRAWFKARTGLRRAGGLEFRNVNEMSPDLARYFVERAPSPKPISNHLSPSYFEWRVFRKPSQCFETIEIREGKNVVGVCVYTSESEKKRIRVHLLDFLRQDLFSSHTFSVMHKLFTKTGSHYIYTWEPLNETVRAAYARCGFVKNPLGRGPFSYRFPFIGFADGRKAKTFASFDARNFDIQSLAQL